MSKWLPKMRVLARMGRSLGNVGIINAGSVPGRNAHSQDLIVNSPL